MFRSSVLDRGPPGPRVFWEDRDRTKTDPQRPKDRRSFSFLKFANFWGFWVNFSYFYYLWDQNLFWPHSLLHLMIRDSGAVQVHAKIVDKKNAWFFKLDKIIPCASLFQWFMVPKKDRKKPEDRCKKDRTVQGPKGRGPRPPEDRKLQDRNITIAKYSMLNVFLKICIGLTNSCISVWTEYLTKEEMCKYTYLSFQILWKNPKQPSI